MLGVTQKYGISSLSHKRSNQIWSVTLCTLHRPIRSFCLQICMNLNCVCRAGHSQMCVGDATCSTKSVFLPHFSYHEKWRGRSHKKHQYHLHMHMRIRQLCFVRVTVPRYTRLHIRRPYIVQYIISSSSSQLFAKFNKSSSCRPYIYIYIYIYIYDIHIYL